MSRLPIVKLITFGGGSEAFRASAARLISQSRDFPAINESRAYTDADLPQAYHDLFSALTGYGFYSWKPYLVHEELMRMEEHDILVYIDAGCELNPRGLRRFDYYLSQTSKHDILLFELPHPNRHWTKNHPKLTAHPEHHFRNQCVATLMFFKCNDCSRRFVKDWLNLCAYENGVLLKPPQSDEPQLPGFKAHRCDQSCLSLCAYQHGVVTLPDETWYEDWSEGRDQPILAIRNRTGASVLKRKLRGKGLNRVGNLLRGR